MSGVDTLAVTADTTEKTTSANMVSQIRTPIYEFIASSSHPKYYVVMCRGLPSRVWDNSVPIASVDYLIGRSDPNLADSVGAEYHQGGGVNYYNAAFAPGSYAGTPVLVTRMDMGTLSTTKAYIEKIKAMYDAMPSPSLIVSANAAGLGGSNYLMDEVRNPPYKLFFPLAKDHSDLASASYSNVPLAMLPGDRRHLCPGHQALRGDLRLLRRRTIATPSWPLNHLKPTDAARLRDVQLDVHFAVYTHTDTSLTRGEIRTLPSLSARGDQLSAGGTSLL
jgi:hypothetical protein